MFCANVSSQNFAYLFRSKASFGIDKLMFGAVNEGDCLQLFASRGKSIKGAISAKLGIDGRWRCSKIVHKFQLVHKIEHLRSLTAMLISATLRVAILLKQPGNSSAQFAKRKPSEYLLGKFPSLFYMHQQLPPVQNRCTLTDPYILIGISIYQHMERCSAILQRDVFYGFKNFHWWKQYLPVSAIKMSSFA